jgi:hypothetical protein
MVEWNNVENVVTILIKICAKKLPLSRVIVVNCIIIFITARCALYAHKALRSGGGITKGMDGIIRKVLIN